jgi:hypothetical protein
LELDLSVRDSSEVIVPDIRFTVGRSGRPGNPCRDPPFSARRRQVIPLFLFADTAPRMDPSDWVSAGSREVSGAGVAGVGDAGGKVPCAGINEKLNEERSTRCQEETVQARPAEAAEEREEWEVPWPEVREAHAYAPGAVQRLPMLPGSLATRGPVRNAVHP